MRMRGLVCSVCAVIIVATLLIQASWAADGPKIGYFDIQTILDKSKWGQQAIQQFNAKKNQVKADMDVKAKQFQTLRDEYEKKAPMLDEKAKTQKAKELLEKQQQGEKALMESNAELNKLSNELTAPIVDKILKIVADIGKKDKYDFILEVGKGGIVYAKDDFNLTNRIIDELNKSPKP